MTDNIHSSGVRFYTFRKLVSQIVSVVDMLSLDNKIKLARNFEIISQFDIVEHCRQNAF
jgi:hypothetical protein